MGVKLYILIALPIVIIAGVFGFMFWVGKRRPPHTSALLDKLGVWSSAGKADEMERMIQYKAVSCAYTVVMFGLLGMTFYELWVKDESGLSPSNLVMLAGVLTQCFAVPILRHRSTEGDEEYKPYPLWKSLLFVIGISAGVAIVGMLLCILILMM